MFEGSVKYSGTARTKKTKMHRFSDSQHLELGLWSRKLYFTCRRF